MKIYDNGGKTFDRYTAVFEDRPYTRNMRDPRVEALAFSENPFHPQGFGQHTSAMPGRHLGKRIELKDLPPKARQFVEQNL